MPLKITITLAGNSFEAEGEFAFDEGFNQALRSWINAQGLGDDGGKVDAMTTRLRGANDRLDAANQAASPQQP